MSNLQFRVASVGFVLLLLVLDASSPVWAQSTNYAIASTTINDPFADLHSALSSAADNVIAATAQGERGPSLVSAPSGESSRAPLEDLGVRTGVRVKARERVEQLRAVIEPILRQADVPAELLAVVLIESGGQPMALSSKGARGIWQFMPDTARRYGLAIDGSKDERVNVQKSTWAAARYLRDLYRRFGSWPLALAAYNAGEDAVDAASARARSTDFTRISAWLPTETRNYVPAVLGAIAQLSKVQPRQFVSTNARRVLYAAATFN